MEHSFSDKQDNPEECNVCLDMYNEEKRRPRTLPCGHTFCTPCLTSVWRHNSVTCPTCRTKHKGIHNINEVPISYIVEAMIKKMRSLQMGPSASNCPAQFMPSAPDCPSQFLPSAPDYPSMHSKHIHDPRLCRILV